MGICGPPISDLASIFNLNPYVEGVAFLAAGHIHGLSDMAVNPSPGPAPASLLSRHDPQLARSSGRNPIRMWMMRATVSEMKIRSEFIPKSERLSLPVTSKSAVS